MLQVHYKDHKYKYILLYIAYFSLAIFSDYNSPLTIYLYDFYNAIPFIALLIGFIVWLLIDLRKDLKEVKIPWIVFLLLARIVLYVTNAWIHFGWNINLFLTELLMTGISAVVFLYAYNFVSDSREEIKHICSVFISITSLQLFIVFLQHGFDVDKNLIIAGIGGSNYAATFLLICVTYMLFVDTKLWEKAIIALGIVNLLLTQSFGAYLAFAVVVVFALCIKLNWKEKKTWYYVGGGCLALLIVAGVFFLTSPGEAVYHKIVQKLGYLLEGDFNSFGSSRLSLYQYSWYNIKKNIWFGTIDNYADPSVFGEAFDRFAHGRTHNFFLESMLMYGIVGTLLNACILGLIVYSAYKNFKKPEYVGCSLVILAAFVHGFVEPNLLTLRFGWFLWLFIGVLLSADKSKATLTFALTKKECGVKRKK